MVRFRNSNLYRFFHKVGDYFSSPHQEQKTQGGMRPPPMSDHIAPRPQQEYYQPEPPRNTKPLPPKPKPRPAIPKPKPMPKPKQPKSKSKQAVIEKVKQTKIRKPEKKTVTKEIPRKGGGVTKKPKTKKPVKKSK